MHKLDSFETFQWQPHDSKGHSIDGKSVELKRYGKSTPPGGLDLCSRFIFRFVDEMLMKFPIATTAFHCCRLEGWIHSTSLNLWCFPVPGYTQTPIYSQHENWLAQGIPASQNQQVSLLTLNSSLAATFVPRHGYQAWPWIRSEAPSTGKASGKWHFEADICFLMFSIFLAILGVWYGLIWFDMDWWFGFSVSKLLTTGISWKLASRAPPSEYTEHQSSCLEFVRGNSPTAIYTIRIHQN